MQRTTGVMIQPPPFNSRSEERPHPFTTSSNFSGPRYDLATNQPISQEDHHRQLMRFFGVPTKELRVNPYTQYAVENLDLPDAYKGESNRFLVDVIISQITEADLFFLRYGFPWRRHQGGMQFNWQQIEFTDHLLGRTPEEGVSRLLTQKSQEFSATIHRHGIALQLEHGFYMTEAGQHNWAMHMRQIANAIVETACYAAVVTALTAIPYEDPNERWREEISRSITDLEAMFRDEISQWAALQKNEGGIGMLASRAEATFNNRGGVTGNVWLWPQGTRVHAQGTAQETLFLLSGRKSGEERDVIRDTLGNVVYGESRGFRRDSHEPRHDPQFRTQTIGNEFAADDAGVRNVPPEEFRTSMLDRSIYNEAKDAPEMFGFMDRFKYGGLVEDWDDDSKGLPLSELGHAFFDSYDNWLDFIRKSDDHGYCIETLLAKNRDVHLDFINNVVAASVADFGAVQAELSNLSQRQQQQPVSGRVQGRTANRLRSGGRSLRDDAYSQVLQHIDNSQWSDRAKSQAKQFATWMNKLPDHGLPLVQNYNQFVQRNVNARFETSHNANYASVAKHLLDYDKVSSLAELHASSHFDLTSFELAYEQARHELVHAKDDPDALRHIKEMVASADRRSPAWRPIAGKRPYIELRVTPYASSQQYIPLVYQSFSLTLSSTNLVLFRVEDKALKELVKNNGVISIDTDNVSTSEPVLSQVERMALLQYSVTLSAIFGVIEAFIESSQNEVSSESRRKLTEVVSALLTEADPMAGQFSVMQKAARIVQSDGFQPLTCQSFAERQILAISSLMHKFYEQGRIATAHLDNYIQDIVESIDALYDDVEVPSVRAQGFTAGKASFANPKQQLAAAEMKKLVEDEHERKKLHDEAVAAVEQIQTVLTKPGDARDGWANPIRVHFDSLVFIYELLKKTGATFLKEKDAPGAFESVAKNMKKLYEDKKGVASAQWARAYVNLAMNTLIQQDTIARDLGLFVPFTSQTLGNIRPQLNKEVDNRSIELSRALEPVVSAIQRHQDGFAYITADSASVDERPENVSDFRQLLRIALSRFTVQVDTDFARAVAIKWHKPHLEQGKNLRHLFNSYSDYLQGASDERVIGYLHRLYDWLPAVGDGVTIHTAYQKADDYLKSNAGINPTPAAPVSAVAGVAATQEKLTRVQLERFLKLMPINGLFMKWALQRNVYIPIQLLCFRPHMRYLMGSAIFLQGGGVCGETLYAWPDFQLADNVVQKMHYGHYTQYMTPVVWSKKHLMVLENVLCSDYLGGHGTVPWNPLDPDHIESYLENELIADMFIVPERANWRAPGSVLDITGRFHKDLGVSKSTDNAIQYTLAPYLSQLWRWENRKSPINTTYNNNMHYGRFNTLCFQAYNQYYNHATKSYSSVISEKGHWADCIYEGSGKVRRGHVKQFRNALMEIGYPRFQVSA